MKPIMRVETWESVAGRWTWEAELFADEGDTPLCEMNCGDGVSFAKRLLALSHARSVAKHLGIEMVDVDAEQVA